MEIFFSKQHFNLAYFALFLLVAQGFTPGGDYYQVLISEQFDTQQRYSSNRVRAPLAERSGEMVQVS